MKKSTNRIPLYGLSLIGTVLSVQAVNIVWPDDQATFPLRPDPVDTYFQNSLFPDTPSNNSVTINNASFDSAYGGYSASEIVTGNTVTLNDGTIARITGGYSASNHVTNNTLLILAGTVTEHLHGGYSQTGNVTGNRIELSNATAKSIAGGYSVRGHAQNNTVEVTNGTHTTIYGGYALLNGDANDNTVELNNVQTYDAIASIAPNGGARGNSMTITDSTIDGVTVSGFSGDGDATGNSITLSNSQAKDVRAGLVSIGNAVSNKVSIANGSTAENVYGGTATQGNATANTVEIADSDVTGSVFGGHTNNGSVTANTVKLERANVTGTVFGGSAMDGNATDNLVRITGGTITGQIIGGSGVNGNASGNSILINGTPDLGNAELIGGIGNTISGNMLGIYDTNVQVQSVTSFDEYNFYLGAGQDQNQAMLTSATAVDLDGATVSIGIDSSLPTLQTGYQVVLFGGSTLSNAPTDTIISQYSVIADYVFSLAQINNQLQAELTSIRTSPRSKALAEGFIAGLGLANQGADMVASVGIGNAVSAAARAEAQPAESAEGTEGSSNSIRFAGFGGVSGGTIRYNTGSHVNMDSVSVLAGIASGLNTEMGRVTVGGFFEYGNGSYNTYNSFNNAASVQSKGNSHYLGGGALFRIDTVDVGPGNIYAEGSLRAGKLDNNYNGYQLTNNLGQSADFSLATPYYGVHLATGYVWKLDEVSNAEFYGQYFWTQVKGDSVTLTTGEDVTFENASSHRLRFGGRYSHALNAYISLYAGAAWEYEFDGKAKSHSQGMQIDAPSLKGNTGVGEIGMQLNPFSEGAAANISMNLGAQGYVGKREGVTGSFQIKYEF